MDFIDDLMLGDWFLVTRFCVCPMVLITQAPLCGQNCCIIAAEGPCARNSCFCYKVDRLRARQVFVVNLLTCS